MKFDELGLLPSLLSAVRQAGYESATPIQEQAIPVVLQGRDLVGCARTGTGKTAAFALPVLQRLMESPTAADGTVRALVLAPTRELAMQIGDSFGLYGARSGLRRAVVYGGVNQGSQVRAIRAGAEIVIATPGRLLDLMQQGVVRLDRVQILVLDEADRMLDMGFLPDLRRIVAAVPRQRQTLMFSATMPDEIRRLAAGWMHDAHSIQVSPVSSTATGVEQSVYFVEPPQKLSLLQHLLKGETCRRTLVFARTKHGADKIVKRLKQSGITAAAIHGNKSQGMRQRALQQFKSPRPPVLVATDIAARGLDVAGVSHVINFDLPEVPETYVHRIGRTARAGKSGVAVSFCCREERGRLVGIERLTGRCLAVVDLPESLPVALQGRTEPAGRRVAAGAKRNARSAGGRRTTGGRRAAAGPPRSVRFGSKRRTRRTISNRL